MGMLRGFRIALFSFLLCVFALTGQFVHADTFQNNLLKMELSRGSLGSVKVTLYTSKPYAESVSVNKKSDYEYVILMPETANSLTSRPTLKSVSDVVKNVDVKTQQYQSQVKGYTKLTISTSQPIEIEPQVSTFNSNYQISDNDYNELMSQAAKRKSISQKKAATKILSTSKQDSKSTSKVKMAALPALKTTQTRNKLNKVDSKTAIQKVLQKSKRQKITNISKVVQTNTPTKTTKKVAAKSNPKVKKVSEPKVEQKFEPTKATLPPNASGKDIYNPPAEKPVDKPTASQAVAAVKTPLITKPKHVRLHKYKQQIKVFIRDLINEDVYTLAGLGVATVIIFLLLLKIMNRASNISKQKAGFAPNLKDMPSPVNYEEKINDDMTWKEKYQTYVEASTPSKDSSNINEDFMASVASPSVVPDLQNENMSQPINNELNELFGENPEEPEKDDLPEEQILDNNDEQQTIENIFEEKLEDNVFENQTLSDDYHSESLLDDFDDLMSEETHDVSIDELFDEEEPFQDNLYQEIQEDVTFTEEYTQPEIKEAEVEVEEVEEVNYYIPNAREQYIEQNYEKNQENKEFIQSEFEIDNGKGFYLVDFEDTTALVGHIDEEIFVLKRFDGKIKGSLQARLNETKGNTSNYMTKVGEFKGIVEVTPEKMNLLIEL